MCSTGFVKAWNLYAYLRVAPREDVVERVVSV